ncbi:MAG: peptidoglycan DD-metalloendopeptidase family protein [Lachnospiraceae bacterium]|nr:peptidoglycan DD-metalloendopeptidase family protein [Lachnospiraceae bacterium]
MIKRKAGVNVKISEVFRKRALFGVAIFCITAIATVGALSIGGNEEDDTPNNLVDLNKTDEPGDTQVADGDENQPEVQDPGQVAENPEDTQNPEVQDPGQVAENPEDTQKPEVKDPSDVAENPDDTQKPEVQDPSQVADIPDETEKPTEVLSPALIAEQLNFDKSAGLLWPISGQVIIPYSPDHGVFYQTLDQFSTSEAIVLSSAVGTEVKAAAKGVVTSIEEDVRTGTTVTLALGNDTSLVYGQLNVTDLKEGDVLEAGECIGTVAEPTRYYVVEGPNLYFKVLERETSVDPTELLKEEQ